MSISKKKIVLTISLLASGRKETTKKCLDSLKPIMEQIPSELIIVDTGCSEEDHALLLEYTDHVIPFTWCQDFSKARNVGLEAASGEWFLYIDDDEWFIEIQEILNFFKSGNYKKFGYATYIQRNFLDWEGKHYSDSWVSRMIRIDKDTRFKSKIHEYLEPLRGACAGLHAIVEHYGYIYKNDEERTKHFERNRVLLDEMIEEDPDNMRWWVQLVQEFRSAHKDEEMLKIGRRGLEKFKDRTAYSDCVDIGTFYAGNALALVNMQRYEEAREECLRAFADKRNTELCEAAICLLAGEADLALGKWNEGELYVLKYLKWCKKLEKQEKKMFVQKMALLINETMDEIQQKKAYSLLICIHLKQKKIENLKKYFDKLQWEESFVYLFPKMIPCLIEGMALIPYDEIFTKVINVVRNHGGLWGKLSVEAQLWETEGKEGTDNLLHVIATVDKDEEYIWYARICDKATEGQGHTEELQELFHHYFEKVDNVFRLPKKLRDIAQKYGVSLEKEYLSVSMDDWKIYVRNIIAESKRDEFKKIEEDLFALQTKDDVHYRYFTMRSAEAELLFKREWDYASCEGALRRFADLTMEFNRQYYRPQIFESYKVLLPPSVQAAYWIQRGFQEEDHAQCNKCLKQAVSVYNGLADIVKEYIRLYGKEQLEKERKAREARIEMRRLVKEIKGKVKQLIDDKMYAEAASVLEQLKTMCPNDLEVAGMGLRLRLGQLGATV